MLHAGALPYRLLPTWYDAGVGMSTPGASGTVGGRPAWARFLEARLPLPLGPLALSLGWPVPCLHVVQQRPVSLVQPRKALLSCRAARWPPRPSRAHRSPSPGAPVRSTCSGGVHPVACFSVDRTLRAQLSLLHPCRAGFSSLPVDHTPWAGPDGRDPGGWATRQLGVG